MDIVPFFSITPNPIALSFVLCGLIHVFFAFYLLRIRPPTATIFWLMLYSVINVFVDVGSALRNMTNNPQVFAFSFVVVDLIYALSVPLLFSFVLSFVNKDNFLRKVWFVLVLYIPVVIMLFLLWRTDLIVIHDMHKAAITIWGREPDPGPLNYLLGIFYFAADIIYLYLLINFYITNKDSKRRKQTKIVIIGFLITVVFTTSAQVLVPQVLHIANFPSFIYALVINSTVLIYALAKYGVGALNIDTISEKLLQLIPSAAIIVTTEKKIIQVNPSAQKLFHYSQEEFLNKDLKIIFPEESKYRDLFSSLLVPLAHDTATHSNDVSVITSTKEIISVNIDATLVKDITINYLLVLTSVQQLKDKSKQIEEKLEEIEAQKAEVDRLNQIMMGREFRILELKKENDELQKKSR